MRRPPLVAMSNYYSKKKKRIAIKPERCVLNALLAAGCIFFLSSACYTTYVNSDASSFASTSDAAAVKTSLRDFRNGRIATKKKKPESSNGNGENKLKKLLSSNKNRSAVMVLATVPLDKRHVTSLWSELDCFTDRQNISKVLLSAPGWSKPIIDRLVQEVKNKLPQFMSSSQQKSEIEIDAKYFDNDR